MWRRDETVCNTERLRIWPPKPEPTPAQLLELRALGRVLIEIAPLDPKRRLILLERARVLCQAVGVG